MIRFESVSKTFSRQTGRMLLRSHLASWFGERQAEGFYALRDVSFHVKPGESMAVVGPNGAGKSTLLSLVAGLCPPDAGRVSVEGRIAALLQLGAGFHQDLTGRENVRLNAAFLGLSRKRTAELFGDIVEFSGVGDFIDEPVRTYSSGMWLRLAFSVAIHTDPDILITDEVLAVGDQDFQAKCIERILDLKRAGKTLLCVSHGGSLLRTLCDSALWLDHGQLIMQGEVNEVLNAYEGVGIARAAGNPTPAGN